MRVKLLTFRYSATLGGFDDTALIDFTRDKEVIAFREHFYVVNEVPHLSCIVHYQDAVIPPEVMEEARRVPRRNASAERGSWKQDRERRNGAPDPCEGLDENERALFNHLREWRARQAREEGLPPYVIATNKNLLAIVRRRPDSPTALGHIEGIGPGKLERYGKALLAALHGSPLGSAAQTPPAEREPTPEEETDATLAATAASDAYEDAATAAGAPA